MIVQRHPGAEPNDTGQRLLGDHKRREESDSSALRKTANDDSVSWYAVLLLFRDQPLYYKFK